jgi:EpsI family protein
VATTAPLRPVYPGASVQAEQALVGGGGRVWLSVSHYANQDAQRQMVSSVNMLVPSTDSPWNLVSSQVVTLGADAAVPAVRAHQLAAGDATAAFGQQNRLRVWQFYWVDGQPVQGDVQAKLRQAWRQLRGQGSAATAVVIYTDDDGSDAAERRLGAFLKANVTPLAAWLSSLDG